MAEEKTSSSRFVDRASTTVFCVCWVLVDRMFRQLRCFHWAFSSGGAVARARCPATLYARDYVFRRRPSRPTAAKGGKKEKEKEMTNKKGN